MAETTLTAETDRPTGSSASRRLRREGRIPAVLYGHSVEPLSVSVAGRELRVALSGEGGLNTLLALKVGSDEHLVMAREVQRHPVRGVVTHVDFQVVDRDQMMAASVVLNTVGEALEIAHADGIVDQQLFQLPVKAKPGAIPPFLEVDITNLTVGGYIRVADLDLPDGVTSELDNETVIVLGVPGRVQGGTEDEEGVATGVEG